jgi:hypothetical protein
MAKTDRKKLIDILDELSKSVVRKRDGNTCQHCKKFVEGSNRHVSHVIPVSQGNKLRWDPLNMKVLCYHCHINWWHKNPMRASEWFQMTFPDRWEYLQQEEGIVKLTISDLEAKVSELKGLL